MIHVTFHVAPCRLKNPEPPRCLNNNADALLPKLSRVHSPKFQFRGFLTVQFRISLWRFATNAVNINLDACAESAVVTRQGLH